MTEPLLDDLRVHERREQQRGVRVAEVLEPDHREPGTRHGGLGGGVVNRIAIVGATPAVIVQRKPKVNFGAVVGLR